MKSEALKKMSGERTLYAIFSELFNNPDEGFKGLVEECVNALLNQSGYPKEALKEVQSFQKEIAGLSIDEMQGNYSYTFELSADYTLDLGHHLFDGFKRANTLLSIKMMYKKYGFPFDSLAGGELPDNLVYVLRFLSILDDGEPVKKDFREDFVVKALEKLDKNFDIKGKQNIYRHLVRAIYIIIDKDVKVS